MSDIASSLVKFVNLGGPGWIADVCDVKIMMDTDLEHDMEPFETADEDEDDEVSGAGRIPVCNASAACQPDSVQAARVQVFTNGNSVKGVIRIIAPSGHSVWHGGVTAKLESQMIDFEKSQGKMLFTQTLQVAEPEYISDSRDYAFDFEEGLGFGSNKLRESFEGDHCAVRHGISVTLNRPWYTFPVMRYLVFGIQELNHHVSEWDLAAQLPDESSLPRPGAASPRRRASTGALTDAAEDSVPSTSLGPAALSLEDRQALEEEAHLELYNAVVDDAMQGIASSVGPVLSLPDCGGIAIFDMGKDVFPLDGVLRGVVRFAFLVHPVTRVTLRVIKEETVNGATYTDQVFAADVLDATLYDEEEEAALLSRARASSGATATPSAAAGAGKPRSGTATIVSTDDAKLTPEQEERLEQIQNNAPIIGEGELSVSLDFSQLAVAPSTLVQAGGEEGEGGVAAADDGVPDVEPEEEADSDDSDDSDYVSDVQITKFRKRDEASLPVVKFYVQLLVSNQRAGDEAAEDEEEGSELARPLPKLGDASLRAAFDYTAGMVAAHLEAEAEESAAAGKDKGEQGGDGETDAPLSAEEQATQMVRDTPRGMFFNTHEVVFFRETWDAVLLEQDAVAAQGVTQLHDGSTKVTAGPPSPSVRQLSPASGGVPGGSLSVGSGGSPAFGARPPPLATGGSNSSLHSGPPLPGMSPQHTPVGGTPGTVPPLAGGSPSGGAARIPAEV